MPSFPGRHLSPTIYTSTQKKGRYKLYYPCTISTDVLYPGRRGRARKRLFKRRDATRRDQKIYAMELMTTYMQRTLFVLLSSLLIALLAACSTRATVPDARPTATRIATMPAPRPMATPTVARVPVTDRELLGAEDVTAACDTPTQAHLICEDATGMPQLEVTIDASTFARWRLSWEGAAPLSGNETLILRLTTQGKLTPNLYLVSHDDTRLGVPLTNFGLAAGTQTLHIPLREVRDRDGNTLDLTAVNALEIVFEWADMQGTMALESLRIERVWREAIQVGEEFMARAAQVQAPVGFQVIPIATDLPQVTQLDFTPAGELLASLVNGRVWRYRDTNGDGVLDERVLYASGMVDLVGLLYDPADGGVWLGSRGQLQHTLDEDGDGVADIYTVRFAGLAWGRHQNNGMAWNPDPDPFTGEPGGTWLYFGFGSTDDLEVGGPWNATVLRFPRDGQGEDDLEVVSMGNRNAYDVAWANLPVDLNLPAGPRAWQLFASENGPDFNDAPDEVNHIRWGHHYGFPNHFGPLTADEIEGEPYSGPVYPVTPHASADGLIYVDNPAWPAEYRTLYVALFGEVFSPVPVGHIVERITLSTELLPNGDVTYRGEPSTFITGLDRPLPLATTPNGNMLVGDYATGDLYEVVYGEVASGGE